MAEKENKNAEKWTEEKAEELLIEAVELSETGEYDFIGEVAVKQKSYIDVYDYLVEKFPQFKHYKTQLKRNCEAACFSNGKNNKIHAGMAIMNLKSNHGWTDRSEVNQTVTNIQPLSKEEIEAADKKIDEDY